MGNHAILATSVDWAIGCIYYMAHILTILSQVFSFRHFLLRRKLHRCFSHRHALRKTVQVDSRARKVLAAVDNPLEDGDHQHDPECSNAVVCHYISMSVVIGAMVRLTHVASRNG